MEISTGELFSWSVVAIVSAAWTIGLFKKLFKRKPIPIEPTE